MTPPSVLLDLLRTIDIGLDRRSPIAGSANTIFLSVEGTTTAAPSRVSCEVEAVPASSRHCDRVKSKSRSRLLSSQLLVPLLSLLEFLDAEALRTWLPSIKWSERASFEAWRERAGEWVRDPGREDGAEGGRLGEGEAERLEWWLRGRRTLEGCGGGDVEGQWEGTALRLCSRSMTNGSSETSRGP